MTISRDVVFDLLPSYFAGELSADSRALVDEWLRADPEFAAMADRFRRLLRQAPATPPGPAAAPTEADTLSRARAAAQRRGEFRGLTVAYAVATVVLVAVALARYRSDRAYVIAAAFGATAAVCGAGWFAAGKRPEWFAGPRWL
jgi:ferric-dicitrate binding protein FerR (iron transport regulator)